MHIHLDCVKKLGMALVTYFEKIVDFDEFSVLRFSLEAGSSVSLPASSAVRVGMVATGQLSVSGQVLKAEEAILVPRGGTQNTVLDASTQGAVFLLAIPSH